MNEGYLKALKREADRERSWRESRQGAFESAFMSLDAHMEKFDDPGKIAAFSDGGRGEERIFAQYDERDRSRRIAEALQRLSPKERRFASAVLRGTTWRGLGIGKRGFNKCLAKICELRREAKAACE